MTGVLGSLIASFKSLGPTSFVALFSADGTDVGSFFNGISVDSSSNYYASGTRFDSGFVQFMFNLELNSSGAIQWQRSLTTTAFSSQVTEYYDVVSDSSGNTYNCGRALFPSVTPRKAILTKYNASGTQQFQRSIFTGTGFSIYRGIAIDSAGDIVVCGDLDFSLSGIIAKYNSSGTIQWQRALTGVTSGNITIQDIAVDSSNNIYVCGSRSNASLNGTHSFIAKYNSSGTIQWQRILYSAINSATNDVATGISLDSSANIYITGQLDYATTPKRGYVAKYDTSGSLQWQRQFDTTGLNVVSSKIVSDSSGNVYASGTTSTNFNPPFAAYLLKYNTSGTLQWQRRIRDTTRSSSPTIRAFDVKLDPSGSVLLTTVGLSTTDVYFSGLWRLSPNGSESGTYVVRGQTMILDSGVFTESVATMTSASGPLTDAAGSGTVETQSMTEVTPTFTNSVLAL